MGIDTLTPTAKRRYRLINAWLDVMYLVNELPETNAHHKIFKDAMYWMIEAFIGQLCDGIDSRSHTVHAYIIREKHVVLFYLKHKGMDFRPYFQLLQMLDHLSRRTYFFVLSDAERDVPVPQLRWPPVRRQMLGYDVWSIRRLMLLLGTPS